MLPIPTRRLAVLAVAASLAALVLPVGFPAGFLLVDGLVLALALVDWARTPRPAEVDVTRTVAEVVTLGAAAPLTWTLTNPTERRLVVGLADALAPSLGAASRRAQLEVPALGRAVAVTTLTPSRRGRFDLGPVTVRIEGPLGLAARQGVRPAPGRLRVHPRFPGRTTAELRLRQFRLLESGLRTSLARGGGTELDSLREYTVDDESRRIDWAATARTGRTIVRTYRAERNQSVVCILDLGRTMAARVADVPRVEHAMDAVLALTHVAGALGDRVGVLGFGAEVVGVVPPRAGGSQVGRVAEAFAGWEPELAEADYRAAFAATLARFRRRSLVVLLTDLAAHTVADTMLPAVPVIARGHLLVVASVTDPLVAGWAGGDPLDAASAFRKAAALGVLEERDRVATRLRSLGASVVDAPPGELTAGVVDAYLQVKRTGSL